MSDSQLLRVDFHSHTCLSHDAWTRPAEFVRRAAAAGLDRIAVTDHGEIDGALEAHALDPGRVIVGEEIMCACGTELIGLFLRTRIPHGLSLEETAAAIREQGGVVYAPHPVAYPTRASWRAGRALAVADVAEVFNARAFLPRWNREAERLAEERGLPQAAGSDAHFPWEVGRAHTCIPAFTDAASLREALAGAVPVGRRLGSPADHLASVTLSALRAAGLPLRTDRGCGGVPLRGEG